MNKPKSKPLNKLTTEYNKVYINKDGHPHDLQRGFVVGKGSDKHGNIFMRISLDNGFVIWINDEHLR